MVLISFAAVLSCVGLFLGKTMTEVGAATNYDVDGKGDEGGEIAGTNYSKDIETSTTASPP